jgi:hypothetical protein
LILSSFDQETTKHNIRLCVRVKRNVFLLQRRGGDALLFSRFFAREEGRKQQIYNSAWASVWTGRLAA